MPGFPVVAGAGFETRDLRVMSPSRGCSLTWENPQNSWSEADFGSRHFAFLTVRSHPLARCTREGGGTHAGLTSGEPDTAECRLVALRSHFRLAPDPHIDPHPRHDISFGELVGDHSRYVTYE